MLILAPNENLVEFFAITTAGPQLILTLRAITGAKGPLHPL